MDCVTIAPLRDVYKQLYGTYSVHQVSQATQNCVAYSLMTYAQASGLVWE